MKVDERDGYYVRPLPGAARWAACLVAVGAFAWGASVAARVAASDTLVNLAIRYPVPPSVLETARSIDPSNAEAAYRVGLYHLDAERPPDYEAAGAELERAIALSPNRSSYYLALGRQREATNRDGDAEASYGRARDLAPSSWKPVWALGNLYVRQSRIPEAAEALGAAARANPELAALAARTLWRASGGDVALASKAAGDSLEGRLELASFLVGEKKLDEALAIWRDAARERPGDERVAASGEALASALASAGRGAEATDLWRAASPAGAPAVGTLANGGFEEPVAEKASGKFEWAVNQSPDARVALGAGREGGKSLRVDYSVETGAGLTNASQYVLVAPGARYTLSFWASTDDLKSGGPAAVTVSDPGGKAQAVSTPIALGTTPWRRYDLTFTGPPGGLAIVSIGRPSCGDVCPIFGGLSVDDLSLSQ
jgi:hypothetical protein